MMASAMTGGVRPHAPRPTSLGLTRPGRSFAVRAAEFPGPAAGGYPQSLHDIRLVGAPSRHRPYLLSFKSTRGARGERGRSLSPSEYRGATERTLPRSPRNRADTVVVPE